MRERAAESVEQALRWVDPWNERFWEEASDADETAVLISTRKTVQEGSLIRRFELITQELISQKLSGQERVARYKLRDSSAADTIAYFGAQLVTAKTVQDARLIESQAGAAYWSAWQAVPIVFPKNDLPRVPEHWRTFGARRSPLSGSARLAATPVNSILNYLYAVLELEANLAVTALGLDPGLAFLHADTPSRNSLACDLMEPVRPLVDSYVLDWTQTPLKREWFFEQRDGNCRLMGSFAVQLSETAQTWARAVAPLAEWVARTLWATTVKPGYPATRLTQSHKRQAKGVSSLPPAEPTSKRENLCRGCGISIAHGRTNCASCAVPLATEQLKIAARSGRLVAQGTKAQAHRAATQRRHAAGRKNWNASEQPAWLTEEVYLEKIRPLLAGIPNSVIVKTLGVSLPYAVGIRHGRRRPHPRHWVKLAELAEVSS